MPSDIRIVHVHEFIKATPEGRLDLEATLKVLLEVAAESAPSRDLNVLLDTRQAESVLSVTDLWFLAAELQKSRKTFARKTAVLIPADRLDYAGFPALCTEERGFEVAAFTSLGDAVAWLAGV